MAAISRRLSFSSFFSETTGKLKNRSADGFGRLMVESSDGDNFIANDCLWVDGIGIVYREE